MKEFLKYIAVGILICGAWAIVAGCEGESPAQRAEAAGTAADIAREQSELKRLRESLKGANGPGEVASIQAEIDAASERLKKLEGR